VQARQRATLAREDLYAVLGVPPEATARQIRSAYLDLMRRCHPDRAPGDAAAAEVARRANAAWTVLGNRRERAVYDRLRARATAPPAPRHVAPATPRSAERRAARRAFQRGAIKAGAVVTAAGAALLLVTS
jgi:curved DNA-binding protein CbpA